MIPKAVLFDLDGVLVKSEEAWFLAMEAAGVRFRGRPVTREEFAPTFGQGADADVESFGLSCTTEELNLFFAEQFRAVSAHVWVNPDAAPLLKWLRLRGIQKAVVTNSTRPIAQLLLAKGGLWELFDAVACSDEVVRPKPAPDLIQLACQKLGRAPSETWMVGDSRFDRAAAQSAGARFVGFNLEAGPGGFSVCSLAELQAALEQVG